MGNTQHYRSGQCFTTEQLRSERNTAGHIATPGPTLHPATRPIATGGYMSATPELQPTQISDALRQLAAEVESHPAQTVDARAAIAWMQGRVEALAAQVAPPLCARCHLAQALAPARPEGPTN